MSKKIFYTLRKKSQNKSWKNSQNPPINRERYPNISNKILKKNNQNLEKIILKSRKKYRIIQKNHKITKIFDRFFEPACPFLLVFPPGHYRMI